MKNNTTPFIAHTASSPPKNASAFPALHLTVLFVFDGPLFFQWLFPSYGLFKHLSICPFFFLSFPPNFHHLPSHFFSFPFLYETFPNLLRLTGKSASESFRGAKCTPFIKLAYSESKAQGLMHFLFHQLWSGQKASFFPPHDFFLLVIPFMLFRCFK